MLFGEKFDLFVVVGIIATKLAEVVCNEIWPANKEMFWLQKVKQIGPLLIITLKVQSY